MNEQAITLMERVRQQLDEAAAVFAAAHDTDLARPCSDKEGESTGTVAAAAAHLAEGYIRLGRFLHLTGYVPAAPTADHGHGHWHTPPPATIADVLALLQRVRQPVALVGELTDDQLHSVPARANRFADGQRTLRQVIDEMTAHQSAHLAAVRQALA
jgi:hypothetical protein